MIDLSKNEGIYLYSGPTDLRKSIDSLLIIIQEKFTLQQMKNKIFMFSNKSKTRLKIIELDFDGVWLYTKRLTKDKFRWPKNNHGQMLITKEELKYLLMGMDITQIHLPLNIEYSF